jgi:hypothetical protein
MGERYDDRKWTTYGLWLKGGGLTYFLMSEGLLEELESPPPPQHLHQQRHQGGGPDEKEAVDRPVRALAVLGDQLHRKSA